MGRHAMSCIRTCMHAYTRIVCSSSQTDRKTHSREKAYTYIHTYTPPFCFPFCLFIVLKNVMVSSSANYTHTNVNVIYTCLSSALVYVCACVCVRACACIRACAREYM